MLSHDLIRTAGLLLATAVILAAPAGAQTVQNAGFESSTADLAPWVEYGEPVTDDPNNDARIYVPPTFGIKDAHEGANIYGAVKNGSTLEGGIHQTVSGLTPGVTYGLSAWIYTFQTLNGSGVGTLAVDTEGGTDLNTATHIRTSLRNDGEWQQAILLFTATGNEATLFLHFHLNTGGFSIVYFDQVALLVDPDLSTDCALDPGLTVSLDDCRLDLDEGPEASISVPPGYLITGLGFRAWFQDIQTMRVQMRELRPDGTLGNPREVRAGVEPNEGLEVDVTLPDCYVMVGFGARAAAETDVTTMWVWARPILPDGSLGPQEEFRSGFEPDHGLERQFQLPPNRVMTGAGMRVSFGDVTGLYVESCGWNVETMPAEKSTLSTY